MKAVVPAAGKGTRLGTITDTKPKGLVEVAGKPLLSHVFETLEQLPPEEIVVIVGYRGDQIVDYYGSSFEGMSLQYVRQDEQLGLAHALLQAEPHVANDFISLHGDNVLRDDLDRLVTTHETRDAAVTCFTEDVTPDEARNQGVFELEDDRIVGLVEKPDNPPSTHVPRGCYVFSPLIFDACRLVTPGTTDEYEVSDAIDLLLYAGHSLATVPVEGWCENVNTLADLEAVAKRVGK